MVNFISIPIMIILVVLQTGIINRIPLLYGTPDLILLVLVAWSLQEKVNNAWIWAVVGGVLVSFVSATPFFAPLIGYLLVIILGRLLQRRIWQTPILAMFVLTFIGTVLYQGILFAALVVNGVPLGWRESLNLVTLPSVLLNMALALPVHSIIVDLSHWLYPIQVDV
jgi:rod shape-determining protein MreD